MSGIAMSGNGADNTVGMFEGYRVFDLSTELAYLGGKILGDLGADV